MTDDSLVLATPTPVPGTHRPRPRFDISALPLRADRDTPVPRARRATRRAAPRRWLARVAAWWRAWFA